MCQCQVSELLDSGVLVVEAGLSTLKNSHRVSGFQTLSPTTMLQAMYGFHSHYAEEKNGGSGMWNYTLFLSSSSYLLPCQDIVLTLGSSINLAQPRECAGGSDRHHPCLPMLKGDKKFSCLPAGAWGAGGPTMDVLCSMTLYYRVRSPACCHPRP